MRIIRYFVLLSISFWLTLLLAGCGGSKVMSHSKHDSRPVRDVDISKIPKTVPKYEPKSRYGNPSSYVVRGHRYYVLDSAKGFNKRGIASWYGRKFAGKRTSGGAPYDPYKMTAASRVLPLPTYVRVTNLDNGRHVIVKVNDRGPFVANRIIDLSYAAAKRLHFAENGTALVQVTAINLADPNATPPAKRIKHPHLYLQVGAFTHREHARALRSRLAHLTHHHVDIRIGHYHDKPLYRVQVGPLAGVGESDKIHKLLTQHGYDAFTVIS